MDESGLGVSLRKPLVQDKLFWSNLLKNVHFLKLVRLCLLVMLIKYVKYQKFLGLCFIFFFTAEWGISLVWVRSCKSRTSVREAHQFTYYRTWVQKVLCSFKVVWTFFKKRTSLALVLVHFSGLGASLCNPLVQDICQGGSSVQHKSPATFPTFIKNLMQRSRNCLTNRQDQKFW